ncbi:MAG: tRNA pseudouridine13 synthase [Methanosarcinales archaeon]|nr:MAG: putative tRNA pseudouridine synthase D [Euryarchaeota archaeon 55_53]MDN5295150.1 tRNA pseudouridine13 synthase [Methanosarcinales archaeon]
MCLSMVRESPHAAERACGMEVYGSDADGIGGVLKARCEDFVVRELYEPRLSDEGRYLLVEVEKTDWDTHQLVREIARRLHISYRRIGFAGTKDKRARTIQLMSIYGVRWEDVEPLRIRDVSLRFVGYSQRDVGLGDLAGNAFVIRVRDVSVSGEECEERLSLIHEQLQRLGGAPNFFGMQRFGTVRPITHEVGRLLVRGDVEGAVMCYIGMPFEQEPEDTRTARERLWEAYRSGLTADAVREALRSFPRHLRYERAMLDKLISGTAEDAMRALPINLQRMFVHALQSYLFNRMLSERLRLGLSLREPQVGEWVLVGERAQRVDEGTLDMAARLVRHGRARVALPIVGYDTDVEALPEYARRVLDDERIEPEMFSLPHLSELSPAGTLREVATSLPSRLCVDDEGVVLHLTLPKGCYATVVLREYTKSP